MTKGRDADFQVGTFDRSPFTHEVASVRAVCEHAFAHRKNLRLITKLRLHARHATALLRALLVLTNIKVAR